MVWDTEASRGAIDTEASAGPATSGSGVDSDSVEDVESHTVVAAGDADATAARPEGSPTDGKGRLFGIARLSTQLAQTLPQALL